MIQSRILLLLLLHLSADAQYDEAFYKEHTKLKPAYNVLSEIIANTANSSDLTVVDVGCGHGFLVDALRKRTKTFSAVHCLESSPAAIPFWPVKLSSFYNVVDLETATSSSMPKIVDVVVSFEVAEHITKRNANNFIKLLTSRTPSIIFFTAATVGQGGVDHFNENSLSYWIDKFQSFGYSLDFKETMDVRTSIVDQYEHFLSCPWYPKNMLVFRHSSMSSKFSSLDSSDIALQAYSGEKWLRSKMPYGCKDPSQGGGASELSPDAWCMESSQDGTSCEDLYDERDRAEFHYLRARAIFQHLENQANQADRHDSRVSSHCGAAAAANCESPAHCRSGPNRRWRVKIQQQRSGGVMRTFILRQVQHDHRSLQAIREGVQNWMRADGGAASLEFFLSVKDRNGQRMIISEHQQLEDVLVVNNYMDEKNEVCVSEIAMQVLV